MSADAIIHTLLIYRYPMLILLALLEGPVVSLTGGFLASLGYLNLWLVVIILVGKDIAVDAVYYALGYFGTRGDIARRFGRKIGVLEHHWDLVQALWRDHPFRTMFVSKLSYGLSLPFMVSAGLTRMPYRRYWLYAAEVALLQYAALVFVGYFFGSRIGAAHFNLINGIQYLIAGIFLIWTTLYIMRSFVTKRLRKESGEE